MAHITSTDRPQFYTLEYQNAVYTSGLLEVGQALGTPLVLIHDADENAYLGKLPASKFPALPDSGWLEQGAIYQYGGRCVVVRQAHQRTIYVPEQTPALFVVYREDAAGVSQRAGCSRHTAHL